MTQALPTTADIDAALAGPNPQARARMIGWAAGGSVEAQLILGQMLLDGRGGAADPAAGFAQFLKAARAGHPMACNMVGRCYENGWGVTPSDDAATSWFRLAAQAGLDWGMYNLATSLALGRGVAQDRAAARAWLEKAVGLNHAKSMTVLGGFLEDGWAGPRDLEGARKLYERGAAGGDFRGAFCLGRLLLDQGRTPLAIPAIRTAWRDATPAFRAQLLEFITARPEPEIRQLAGDLTAAAQG